MNRHDLALSTANYRSPLVRLLIHWQLAIVLAIPVECTAQTWHNNFMMSIPLGTMHGVQRNTNWGTKKHWFLQSETSNTKETVLSPC
jgi:hypothetical protein